MRRTRPSTCTWEKGRSQRHDKGGIRRRAEGRNHDASKEDERLWHKRDVVGGAAAFSIAAAWLTPQVRRAKEKERWFVEATDEASEEERMEWMRTKQKQILLEERRVEEAIEEQQRKKEWMEKDKDLVATGIGTLGAFLLVKEWTGSLPKSVQIITLGQEEEEDNAGQRMQMVAGGATLPHPDKRNSGGEDAFFVSATRQGAVGVADGVGGWSNNGVDAGEYARTLMQFCKEGFEQEEIQDPYQILRMAHGKTDLLGSATACVLTLAEGEVWAANVGDSSFRVLRDGKVVYSSPLLLHAFNCPYQLASRKHVPLADPVSKADRFSFRPRDQDIIVLATDGVFDNLFDEQLVDMVEGFELDDSASSASACASQIVERAQELSMRPGYVSPFAVQAREAGVLPYDAARPSDAPPSTGKLDDATCVVAVVTTSPGRFGIGSVI